MIKYDYNFQEGFLNLYVDMGLPSGTLWAKSNIDVTQASGFASSPYQYECSFFSWGNVDGHNPTSNSSFSPYNWGSINAESPYYENQVYGSTQGNTLTNNIPVGVEFDAARANLGGPWRTPSTNEFKELFDNIRYINAGGTEVDTTSSNKQVVVNNVKGLYLESTINGARLFFPCEGYAADSSWGSRGSSGYYWSSTWSSARDAQALFCPSIYVSPQNNNYRCRGYAVRPVISKSDMNPDLQQRYIGSTPVGRVYIGDNLVWETKEGYGVRWVHDGDGTITRIGNMEYHKTLPIQSKMKRCILTSTGVVRYVSDSDYTKDTSGNTIDYTADNQDVMVEIPEHYYEAGQVTEDNVTYDYIMLYPSVRLGKRVPKHYIGAFEAMTKNNDNSPVSLWSTCKTNIVYEQDGSVDLGSLTYTNDAADYRGGNRNASSFGDDTDKSLLGKPATYINITNFASYGTARGTGYAIINWASWNSMLRLYVVEYANFNSQAAFNSSLTADGYHQGGLGAGVTNVSSAQWNNLLLYNPFIPCGVTLSLGSNTGTVKCTLPSTLSAIASNTYVPSYRGIENPFGHIWQITNGISVYGSGTNYIFRDNNGINTRTFTSASSTTAPSGFTLVNSTTPLSEGWISTISFDENGEFTPKTVLTGQSNSQDTLSPFRDYFWGTNTGAKRLLVGGHSAYGVRAGLFCFHCSNAVSLAHALHGSRLLYVNDN